MKCKLAIELDYALEKFLNEWNICPTEEERIILQMVQASGVEVVIDGKWRNNND